MNDPNAISKALHAPFPVDLIEKKQGMDYIGQEHIRHRLIEATGNCFDFSIQSFEVRNDGALRDRTNRDTGEIISTPVAVVIGTLRIDGLGSRTDVGVQEIQAGGGADAAYKGAVSDCIKRCAMSFGVALQQLYIDSGKPAPPQRSTRQQSPERTRQQEPDLGSPMNDGQFSAAVTKATKDRDNELLRKCVANAGTNVDRWKLLVVTAPSKSALGWLERQIDQRGVKDHSLADAILERRDMVPE